LPLPASVWLSNPKLSTKLALPVHFDEFSIRPPAGLELSVHQVDGGVTTTATWRRPGATVLYGGLKVSVENSTESSATDAVNDWLVQSGQQQVDTLTHSAIETGTVDGNLFARAYYKGPTHGGATMVHGFVYAAVVGSRLFVIEASDTDTRYRTALPIAEAAARSLIIVTTESTGIP